MELLAEDRVMTAEECVERVVAVAVVTPIGTYPDEGDFRRVAENEVIEKVLKLAAEKLELTNTKDWVASVCGAGIDVRRSFSELHLSGIVEIEWHKHEGGGGARDIGES